MMCVVCCDRFMCVCVVVWCGYVPRVDMCECGVCCVECVVDVVWYGIVCCDCVVCVVCVRVCDNLASVLCVINVLRCVVCLCVYNVHVLVNSWFANGVCAVDIGLRAAINYV